MPANDNTLTAEVAAELRTAWQRLGGKPDMMPDVADGGTGLYEAFVRQGATSDLLAIIGSYRDTADDAAILKWLRLTNAKPAVT